MTSVVAKTFREDDWIRKFDPEKRMLTGRSYLFTKRIMDLVCVILSSIFWIPLFGFIALLISFTSPGAPAVFTQWRTGKAGKRFRMYKFRSMVATVPL